jgi:methanogenic corrinoid protein MtbC1
MVVSPGFIVGPDGLVSSCFRWFVLFICYILLIKSTKIAVIDGHVYTVMTLTAACKHTNEDNFTIIVARFMAYMNISFMALS